VIILFGAEITVPCIVNGKLTFEKRRVTDGLTLRKVKEFWEKHAV
jgi:hypothetical protein